MKSSYGIAPLINYVFQKESRYWDEENRGLVYSWNMLDGKPQKYIDQFEENLKLLPKKARSRIKLHHIILSFSPEDTDKMNTDILKRTVRKFIGLYNKKAQFLAVGHDNGSKRHVHVHLIGSGIELSKNKALTVSKMEFSRIQQEMQIWQKRYFPELEASLVNYGAKEKKLNQTKHTEYQVKKKERMSKKEKLKHRMERIYHRSTSKEDFLAQLKTANIEVYNRAGKETGVLDPKGNKKYRFRTLGINLDKLKEREVQKLEQANSVPLTTIETENNMNQVNKTTSKREKEHLQYEDLISEIEAIRILEEENSQEKER